MLEGVVLKSFQAADGSTIVEGWVSTPALDLQKEEYSPLAFAGAIADYMSAGGPLSCEHNTQALPVGHMQRVAVVQDGHILKASEHPTDPAHFQFFPNTGSGLYGRAKVTEPTVGYSVKAGNLRAFSWIGKPTDSEPLPGGGRRVTRVYPLLETTLTAYPVNQLATVLAAKAKLPSATDGDYLSSAEFHKAMNNINRLLTEALLGAVKTALARKGYVPTLEDDPVAYLVHKAQTPEGLTSPMEQALFAELVKQVMYEGLSY